MIRQCLRQYKLTQYLMPKKVWIRDLDPDLDHFFIFIYLFFFGGGGERHTRRCHLLWKYNSNLIYSFEVMHMSKQILNKCNCNIRSILPHICVCMHLLLIRDAAIRRRCSLRFLVIGSQFINQKFILAIISHIMLQKYRMTCHWKFELLLYFHALKGDLKPVCSLSSY